MTGGTLRRNHFLSISGLVLFCLVPPADLGAQNQLTIRHSPVSCLSTDDFVQISAGIQSPEGIRTAKVYFRANTFPDFYFVEMTRVGETYQAYLPLPDGQTSRVVYYIEAVDGTFNSNRTVEHDPKVTTTGECREDDPLLAWFTGDTPNIIVGAIRSGVAALPPGFQAAGIAGLVSGAGGTGGGLGVVAAVTAAAGAGATIGVLKAQDPETPGTTSSVQSGTTPPSTSIPTTTTSAPGTSTVPPPSPPTTTIPSPSTSTTSTPSTTSTVPTTSTIPVTTTLPQPTTTTIAPPTACFIVQDADGPAGCAVAFDASCSTGDILSYFWRFQDDPPFEENKVVPTTMYDWSSNPECGTPFARLVRLTVTAQGGATAEAQAIINPSSPTGLRTFERADPDRIETSFISLLTPPLSAGRIEAQIVTNGADIHRTDNAAPHRHTIHGLAGRNVIEAYVTSAPQTEISWQLDFSGSEHFVPGSVQVETGAVMAQSGHAVVLRLSGVTGESIRLSFQLGR